MKRLILLLLIAAVSFAAKKKPTVPPLSPLDHYVSDARARSAAAPSSTPGGVWAPGSRIADGARDRKASQVDDMITVVVVENASAVSSGTTKTSRVSSTKNSISALPGLTKAAGPWANLAGVNRDTELNRPSTTTRNVVISPTLTARGSPVMPNPPTRHQATPDFTSHS